jgi:hypothetical protein
MDCKHGRRRPQGKAARGPGPRRPAFRPVPRESSLPPVLAAPGGCPAAVNLILNMAIYNLVISLQLIPCPPRPANPAREGVTGSAALQLTGGCPCATARRFRWKKPPTLARGSALPLAYWPPRLRSRIRWRALTRGLGLLVRRGRPPAASKSALDLRPQQVPRRPEHEGNPRYYAPVNH